MKRILLLTSCFLFVVSIGASALTIDPPAQDTTKKKEGRAKKKDNQNAEKTTHSGTSSGSNGSGSGNGNQAGMTISEKGLPNDRPKGSKATSTVSPVDSAKSQTSEPKAGTPHQE